MLKLFKHNWKRNELLLYTTLGVSVLLYTLLLVASHQWKWWDELVFGLGIGVMSIVGTVMTLAIMFTFNYTLKSYLRRMIPVTPTKELSAFVLLMFVYTVINMVILFIFLLILQPTFRYEEVQRTIDMFVSVQSIVSLLLNSFAYVFYFISVALFSIAFARMFRTNLKLLIFIGIHIVFVAINVFVTDLLFNDSENYYGTVYINESFSVHVKNSIEWFTVWSPLVIDMLFGVIAFILTTYIMKKKIEL